MCLYSIFFLQRSHNEANRFVPSLTSYEECDAHPTWRTRGQCRQDVPLTSAMSKELKSLGIDLQNESRAALKLSSSYQEHLTSWTLLFHLFCVMVSKLDELYSSLFCFSVVLSRVEEQIKSVASSASWKRGCSAKSCAHQSLRTFTSPLQSDVQPPSLGARLSN